MKKNPVPWLGLLLVVFAVANELRKAPAERSWHDQLFGVLPYDFRVPTWTRLKQSVWNPHNDRIFVPHSFGVGWSVNIGGVLKQLGLVG